jgi:hypothetical protein
MVVVTDDVLSFALMSFSALAIVAVFVIDAPLDAVTVAWNVREPVPPGIREGVAAFVMSHTSSLPFRGQLPGAPPFMVQLPDTRVTPLGNGSTICTPVAAVTPAPDLLL